MALPTDRRSIDTEIRNGIRHSRTVDEITRKEGEAAILWFEQLNGRWSTAAHPLPR